jgi:hypothetical protein
MVDTEQLLKFSLYAVVMCVINALFVYVAINYIGARGDFLDFEVTYCEAVFLVAVVNLAKLERTLDLFKEKP